jgi:hypothetical protein
MVLPCIAKGTEASYDAFLLFQYILADFGGFNLFIKIKVLFSQTESGGL